MRAAFVQALSARAAARELVLLTGDLGFRALEPLRDQLGARFLNCGVAEQGMVGVAAGLALEGHEVWVYSIAPFLYARALEQIRNDLGHHRLPVRMVGNGGGYGYGVMGPSHHALEDYGTLSAVGVECLVPAFDQDLPAAVEAAAAAPGPSYLRLGRGELEAPAAFAGWRKLRAGAGPCVVACGPLVGGLLRELERRDLTASVWGVGRVPVTAEALPPGLCDQVRGRPLLVAEEHARVGGVASQLVLALSEVGAAPSRLVSRTAGDYSGRYGSQAFHRDEAGLSAAALADAVAALGGGAATRPGNSGPTINST